ncbi:MAG: porin [Rhizobacter sp.]|nr:porin [Rhizobacter sp.]
MQTRHLQKTILAAAVLLATGAAHAQSSVTLYGLLDLAVNQHKAGSNAGGTSIWRLNDGTVNGLNGSRWGVRVAEDLGGGLKANAVLESGLLADTGAAAQGGLAFGRQVFVGLSSASLGEVRLGRQYVLEDSVMGLSNPFGNALVNNQGTGVTNAGRALPFWLNAPRANNVIQYQTPNLGGFTATAQLAPGEGTADRFHGVKFGYGAGPFNAAMSYEWTLSRVTDEQTNKSLTIGANYNFGPVKLLGGIQRDDELATGAGNGAFTGGNLIVTSGGGSFTAIKINGYTVGVEIPTGPMTWGVNYSGVKYESASGQTATLGKAAVAARYGLSKNTFLYAGFSVATGDLKHYIAEERVLQAGLRMAW